MITQSLDAQSLVTIAIPCFNAQTTIERAILSAQNQDWPNIDILIVDDASEDGTIAIIEALAKKDKRIRLICQKTNQGVAVARNTLLENARGEFIAFFDADDESYPERVRLQYQRLTHYEQESGADLILCYAGRKAIPSDGKTSYELKGVGHGFSEPVGWEYIWHYLPVKDEGKKTAWGHSASSALFMRRAVFDRVGPFDSVLRRSEDIDYAIRAGLGGAHFISVAQPLLDWNINEADYKTDEKNLYYHHLMYQKYKYLFSNGYQYWRAWQFAKLSLCRYMAISKNEYPSMIWYFGGACFWLFVISPRAFFNKARVRLVDIVRNRRANKTALTLQKAGEKDAAEARQVMSPQPLVTIAIPCFNAQTTIERAIKSAQNQNWPNTEILIVDDGSEDGTISIIEALAKKDKRMKLICRETNQGVAAARNILLEKARGEFIAFFDADDVSYPERIRLQYQRLTHYEQENKADLILCYAGRRSIPANGESPYELKGVGYEPPEPVGWEYIGHYIPVKGHKRNHGWGDSGSGSLFMRRTVFDKVGPFDSALRRSEDIDYAIRAGLGGAHFISVNQPLLDWHINEAEYKTDKKLLHYHRLMYQKYKYLFPNEIQYWCAWQSTKVAVCRYIARSKNDYPAIIWYFAWACFWLFLLSPRAFFRRVEGKFEDIARNRRTNRTALAQPKAGK